MPTPSETEDLDPELVERVFALSGESPRLSVLNIHPRSLMR
jgi:hypothetical protein